MEKREDISNRKIKIMLLIGSQALHANGIKFRDSKDIDYVCSQTEYYSFVQSNLHNILIEKDTKFGKSLVVVGSKPIEFEIAKNNNSVQKLLNLFPNQITSNFPETEIASPELVYTLKMSHRFLKNSPHFKKTMDDILTLRKLGYGEIPKEYKSWYKDRIKETYTYSHPILNQKRKDFFRDDFYVYDHDTIHEAVKLFDKPAYDYIKINTAEVLCSKEKFMSVDEQIKLATVYEESCVLALERHQIPNNYSPLAKTSFLMALEKVCTSISSGWWREYAWENYYKVVDLYDSISENYIDRFKNALESDLIKPWVK